MVIACVIISALAGALGRRMAGGLQPKAWPDFGTQPKRAFWGVTAAITVWVGGLAWGAALAAGAAIWAGSTVGYGPPWRGNDETTLRMGHKPDGAWASWGQFWTNFGWMTYHGTGGVLPCVALFAWLGYGTVPLALAGLFCAPVYVAAWCFPWNIPVLGCYRTDPPPTAELIWGALVGAALFVSAHGP